MKKSILIPLSLGLLLTACSRTGPDSKKISSNDQPTSNELQYDDTAAIAKNDSADQSQAVAASPAASAANQDTSYDTSKPAADSSRTVATPAPDATDQTASLTPSNAPALDAEPTSPDTTTTETTALAANTTTDALTPMDEEEMTESESESTLAGRLTEWKLTADDIKDEFESSGRVTRSKPAGADQPTGPMDDILVGLVKSELQGNADTAELKIEVSAENGTVTLNGSAQSLDQIGKAVAIALDTDGVTQAISTITLESAP